MIRVDRPVVRIFKNELILKVNPVLIGSGIPLFDGVAGTRAMNLAEQEIYANGFAFARYVRA
jgi:hypothetical protein